VARAWQLAVVRAATRLNQDGERDRARRLVELELKYLTRYCEGLPEAESLLNPLRRMLRSVGREIYDRTSAKEMRVASLKAQRGEREHRVSAAMLSWVDHLPE